MGMSASEMVRLRMVMGNMVSIYQKKKRDASKICGEVKIIFRGGFSFRNIAGGIVSDAIPWVETKNGGLKMSLKSRVRRF